MSNQQDRAILNCIFNPLLPVGESIYDEELPADLKDEEEDTPATEAARALEAEGIRAAESGDLDGAVAILTRAVAAAPGRPSAHNNRAQAHRMRGDVAAAAVDLDEAIRLAGGRGRSGCRALCQRGAMLRGAGEDAAAREDFRAAAALGSRFARAQLVETDPYAAMCNQMLHQLMGKLN